MAGQLYLQQNQTLKNCRELKIGYGDSFQELEATLQKESLRGEIGASAVRSRIMETFLAFIISVYKGKFNNLKLMMDDAIKRQKGKLFKAANKYRENLELSWNDINEMDRKT